MTVRSVVTWRWRPRQGYRSTYGPETVNTLFRMVRRHYGSFTPICVTDDPAGLDPSIVVIPDRADFADLPSPHGGTNPSCYRRLRMFHPEAATWFGERFVSIDLDVVITGDLRSVWDRPEPIVLWGDTNPQPGSHYNGSMVLMTAGARSTVWTTFDPNPESPTYSPRLALANRSWGSDQGWLSYSLGPRPPGHPRGAYPGEAKWTKADGVYSFRNDLHQRMHHLPPDAKVTVWHGHVDPWSPYAQQIAWVRKFYNGEGLDWERANA